MIAHTTVAKLRKLTGCGFLDCHLALRENDGDIERARLWLTDRSSWINEGRISNPGPVRD